MERDEARAALEGMMAAERRLAEGPDYPMWRHAVFGAIMAGLTLAQGFGAHGLPLTVFAMAGIAWIVTDDRRRYGMFVNGYRKGRTLQLTLGLVVLVLGAMGVEIYARTQGLPLWVKLATAGAVFFAATGASIWWTRIYQRELRGE